MLELIKSVPPELVIFVLSMLPVWELRGSIPLAIHTYSMTPLSAFLWSFLGNFTAGLLLVYLLDPAVKLIVSRIPFLLRFYRKVSERASRKHSKKVELYAEMAIFFIVALPLPGTGAWTGALVSRLFRLNKFTSVLSIGLGLLACGLIVLLLSSPLFISKF